MLFKTHSFILPRTSRIEVYGDVQGCMVMYGVYGYVWGCMVKYGDVW